MTDIGQGVAFVTGGGGSIGGAIARALAAEGASVAVADILPEHAATTVDAIRGRGGTAIAVACDQSDRESLRQAKAEVNRELGPVSLLFVIAGATSFQRLVDMTDDDVDWLFGTNLMGVVNCLRAFVPDMIEAGSGHVLATSSTAGLRPAWVPQHSAYAAAKLGVIGLMFNLRAELEESGIQSTLLVPAGVATQMGKYNHLYRPPRFGPPVEIHPRPPESATRLYTEHKRVFRPADEVAQMVMLAVRENRPIVSTDGYDRKIFQETYVDPFMTAFDQVEAFDRAMGQSGPKGLSFEELHAASAPPQAQ